ncbi:MAG: bifunctional demethylmenaquinone methyltransferase/2-methoxy-6-polyprenyl-1,4-benzoquinol methylase UbiE [Alphaproteobacteria bacterium]|nr:bifunctional demethylmenaquinone methyltransferase/2-methoxy-6-polyprenyl-1,4-benzoquinol methylase UbiE [Alphaproteobacteria bacterium]
MSDKKYTDFGFQKVPFSEKQSMVNSVFSRVANKYDLMNDLMSFGIHRLWKKEFLSLIPEHSGSLLDVAGGSGDISLGYYKNAQKLGKFPNITLCDINISMLQSARAKFIDNNVLGRIEIVVGDAMELPFPDNSFDNLTIAFGIRNVADIQKALGEFKRVLKKGGKFLCLEFSKVDSKLLSKIYEMYSFNIIPKIGKVITNDEDSYKYLVESIKKFPTQEAFANMMKDAGLEGVNYIPLSSGVVSIHYGYKF